MTVAALGDAAVALWQGAFWVLVHGTVLAGLAWLLTRTVLRGARPALIAALWTIVLLKFVLPVGPAMPWTVSSALDALVGADAPAPQHHALPAMSTAAAKTAAAPTLSATGALALGGAALWLAAISLLVLRRVREQRALRRRAEAGVVAAPEVIALVAAAAHRLGLRRTPAVRVDPRGAVPWVLGLGRAVLVLPASLAAGDRAELAAVVAHELAHLRRRDAWLRLLQVAAGTVFFFVPVVRWVNRRVDAARELACDAWAVDGGPLAPHDYARMLVRLVRERTAAPSAALALAAQPALLGRRVDALLAGGRGLRAGVGKPGAALLAGWAVVALGGASRSDAAPAPGTVECQFSPELAAEILNFHPAADADGDGQLTRDEACDYQLELGRQQLGTAAMSVELSTSMPDEPPLVEGLCCNCGSIEDTSAPVARLDPPATCSQE